MFFNKKEDKPKITFRLREDHEDVFPEPKRSSKFMPEWLKKLPRTVDTVTPNSKTDGTIKRCVPVLDAVSNGYIIPLWADLQITVSKSEPCDEFPEGDDRIWACFPSEFGMGSIIENHGWDQVGDDCPIKKFPLGRVLMKFISPWVIETSPGWSCLYKSPPHQYGGMHIMEGVVDTDTYKRQVNFPWFWMGAAYGETIIPKGTPLIHVIPFRREEMDMEIDTWDHKYMTMMDHKHNTHFIDKYRKLWWHKRTK